MDSTAKIPLGVVHGRFQPPHKGHLRYMLAALDRAEHLVIGICTPTLCTPEEARATGYPCTAELNPFTFDERVEMLTAALAAEHVSRDRYSFVSFPSDYRNLDEVVPRDAVFLMSVTSTGDAGKVAYIESLGYKTETVLAIPEDTRRERSGAVREQAGDGQSDWEELVPPAIATYMKSHGLIDRLASLGKDDTVQ